MDIKLNQTIEIVKNGGGGTYEHVVVENEFRVKNTIITIFFMGLLIGSFLWTKIELYKLEVIPNISMIGKPINFDTNELQAMINNMKTGDALKLDIGHTYKIYKTLELKEGITIDGMNLKVMGDFPALSLKENNTISHCIFSMRGI